MADMVAQGEKPEVLFWVGCAGSYDDRYKAVTKAFVMILNKVGIKFAVLGPEETCTGDPARRAGNALLFHFPDVGPAKHRGTEWLQHQKDCDVLSALLQYAQK